MKKNHIFNMLYLLIYSFVALFSCSEDSDDHEFYNTDSAFIKGNEITLPTFSVPTVVFANYDNESTSHDNIRVSAPSIVQVADDLFYMYYECYGTGSFSNDEKDLELAFAFSEDGFNWKREIPEGIKSPVDGTNLIFDWRIDKEMVIGIDVVKVNDPIYPYRMIGSKGKNMAQTICLWKSKDGVHFEQMRVLLNAKYDSKVSIIVRGNVLKVYLRMRENGGNTTRQIGVMYIDLEGNVLSPPTTLFGDYYYQAGASIIDDRRELLLPTYYDEKSDKNWYDAFVVDGTKIIHLDTNINEALINPEKDGWGIVCPKIITIGFEQYIYYMQWNYTHGKKMIGNENEKKTEIRCSKITWDTKGKPYKQF